MKLPTVDQKEIVPVRLIPLVANGWLGHETLSGIFANKLRVNGFPYPQGGRAGNNGVHAFHLNDEGLPVQMWESEWDDIYREISLLEPLLRKDEERNGVPGSKEFVWRLEATRVLPAGVFMWRDDLDRLWDEHLKSFVADEDDVDDTDILMESPSKDEPEDFRKLNYDRHIKPEYKGLILEGFEHLTENILPSPVAPAFIAIDTPETLRDQLTQDGHTKELIAAKLKEMFPSLTPHRIGKLITEDPRVFVEADTYRKRGERLLAKARNLHNNKDPR